jgi:hypothetical protein
MTTASHCMVLTGCCRIQSARTAAITGLRKKR